MAASLDKLFGMTEDAIELLNKEGIDTIEQFYEIAKHVDSRNELADKTGIEAFKLEEWSSTAGNYLLMMDCEW